MFRSISILLAAAFALPLLVSSPASADTASVHDNHLEYMGKNYFRVGADVVTLGAYGEKKSPLLKGNYLEVQSTLPPAKIAKKVTNAAVVAIDFTSTKKAEIEANLSGIKVVNAGTTVTYEALKTAKLKLVHVVITAVDIRDAANSTAGALANLKSYGKDARISQEIFVVMEAELADSFTASNTFEVTGTTTTGITITGKHTVSGGADSKVVLSKGTTFAYLLVKLQWNSAKTAIEKATDDVWGPS